MGRKLKNKNKLRCDSCGIFLEKGHVFDKLYTLSVGGVDRTLDKWCYDDLKKMSKYRRIVFMRKHAINDKEK